MASANVKMCGYIDNIDRFAGKKSYFNAKISCIRDSGRWDTLNLVIPEDVAKFSIKPDMKVNLDGFIRSRNYKVGEKSHLALEIVANPIEESSVPQDNTNSVIIDEAYVVKPIILRRSPLGRDICDIIIAVNTGKYSNYIPCIAWGKTAKMLSKDCSVGSKLTNIAGRFQSREYQKVVQDESGEPITTTRTAYELSIKLVGGIK